MQTVIGAFDDRAQAQRAVDELVENGFDRGDVHVEQQEGSTVGTAADGTQRPVGEKHQGGIGGFFASLFGTDEDRTYEQHASTYNEAVRRGSSVVVVDARDESEAERAVACLHELGAIDVDERARQWRAEGWGGATAQDDLRQGEQLRSDSLAAGKEGVVDVVQEELQVGKRSLDKGGVRVVQRLSEKPVSEVVRLREERAVVDRRAVDRPVEPGATDTFRAATLEVREMAEEPVVAKTARVVEEVRVGKQVQEREETIQDKVRRKDVEVERLDSGSLERERAVASDTRDPLSPERDPEAGNLTGRRRSKNSPSE